MATQIDAMVTTVYDEKIPTYVSISGINGLTPNTVDDIAYKTLKDYLAEKQIHTDYKLWPKLEDRIYTDDRSAVLIQVYRVRN